MITCCRNTPLGRMLVTTDKDRVIRIEFTDEETSSAPETALHKKAFSQLTEYFSGKRESFDLPLELRGTDFQKQVWRELMTIPYGNTASYGEIARRIGRPKACRAVGGANHNNHLLIVVPCHRVIAADGSLGGFGCGLDIKAQLLDLEKDNK